MTSRRNLLMALLFLSAAGISAPLYARMTMTTGMMTMIGTTTMMTMTGTTMMMTTMMMTAEGVLADGKTEIN